MTGKLTENRIGLTLILVGFIGAVLFFPLKFGSGETCLAQHYVQGESEHTEGNSMMVHGHSLAQYYVFHYGLLWWFSMGLSVAGFYFVRKKKKLLEDMNMGQVVKREEGSTITESGKEGVM